MVFGKSISALAKAKKEGNFGKDVSSYAKAKRTSKVKGSTATKTGSSVHEGSRKTRRGSPLFGNLTAKAKMKGKMGS